MEIVLVLAVVLFLALARYLLARADGFTFWTNRPVIGWAAYNARRDAAVAAAREEEEHAAACLAALTPLDVQILSGLGWEPPDDVRKRIELHEKNERYRRAVQHREEVKKKKAEAAARAYVISPDGFRVYRP